MLVVDYHRSLFDGEITPMYRMANLRGTNTVLERRVDTTSYLGSQRLNLTGW